MAKLRNGYSLNPRALWAGEVPDGWEFFKGKYVFGERFEKGNEKNLELLSPTQKYGVIPQSMYDELSGMRAVKVKESTDLSLFKTVHTGDFCISLRSFQGGFEYSRYEGVVSPAYHILFPKKNIVDGYYKYLFKEKSFIAEMNSYCQSLRDGKNISYEDFGKTVIPYPPLDEQRAIADYLDERCSKIDEIISEATASIEEYKGLKQAVITDTVTKGLNKQIPLKNSGYDYIGDIPVHWSMCKVRHIGNAQNGISFGGDAYGEGYPFVSYGDVYRNFSLPEHVKGLIQSSDADRERYSVQKGDIFFTRTSETKEEIGFSCVCTKTIPNAVFAGFLIRVRPFNEKLDTGFAKYYFRSNHLRAYFVKEMNLVIRASLGQELLKGAPVLLPPIDEQKEIAVYLDKKCSLIDSIIDEKEAMIQELQAYKKSLIYEVVTGKRRVV